MGTSNISLLLFSVLFALLGGGCVGYFLRDLHVETELRTLISLYRNMCRENAHLKILLEIKSLHGYHPYLDQQAEEAVRKSTYLKISDDPLTKEKK